MVWDRTNRPLWFRCAVGVLVVFIAAAIRLLFLEILELRATFVVFFPAVAVAALYGGLGAGLLATVVSTALARYFWMVPVGQFGIKGSADLMSMPFFSLVAHWSPIWPKRHIAPRRGRTKQRNCQGLPPSVKRRLSSSSKVRASTVNSSKTQTAPSSVGSATGP